MVKIIDFFQAFVQIDPSIFSTFQVTDKDSLIMIVQLNKLYNWQTIVKRIKTINLFTLYHNGKYAITFTLLYLITGRKQYIPGLSPLYLAI